MQRSSSSQLSSTFNNPRKSAIAVRRYFSATLLITERSSVGLVQMVEIDVGVDFAEGGRDAGGAADESLMDFLQDADPGGQLAPHGGHTLLLPGASGPPVLPSLR